MYVCRPYSDCGPLRASKLYQLSSQMTVGLACGAKITRIHVVRKNADPAGSKSAALKRFSAFFRRAITCLCKRFFFPRSVWRMKFQADGRYEGDTIREIVCPLDQGENENSYLVQFNFQILYMEIYPKFLEMLLYEKKEIIASRKRFSICILEYFTFHSHIYISIVF